MANQYNGRDGNGYQPLERPEATEWPHGGPDAPKKRIVSDDVPVSVIIFVVAYSAALGICFALGVTYGS